MNIFSSDDLLDGLARGAAKFGGTGARKLVNQMRRKMNGFSPDEQEPYGAGLGGAGSAQGGQPTPEDVLENAPSKQAIQDSISYLKDALKKDEKGSYEFETHSKALAGFERQLKDFDLKNSDSSSLGFQSAEETTTAHLEEELKNNETCVECKKEIQDGQGYTNVRAGFVHNGCKAAHMVKGNSADSDPDGQSMENSADLKNGQSGTCSNCGKWSEDLAMMPQGGLMCKSCAKKNSADSDPDGQFMENSGTPCSVCDQSEADHKSGSNGACKKYSKGVNDKKNSKPNVCAECDQPIPEGEGRIGYDGGKCFHDDCYRKVHNSLQNAGSKDKCDECGHSIDYHRPVGKDGKVDPKGDKYGPKTPCDMPGGCSCDMFFKNSLKNAGHLTAGDRVQLVSDPGMKGKIRSIKGSLADVEWDNGAEVLKSVRLEDLKLKNAGHLTSDAWQAASLEERVQWLERAGEDINLATYEDFNMISDTVKVALQDAVDMPGTPNTGNEMTLGADPKARNKHPSEGAADAAGRAQFVNASGSYSCSCGKKFEGPDDFDAHMAATKEKDHKGVVKNASDKKACIDCGSTKDLQEIAPDYMGGAKRSWICKKCQEAVDRHDGLHNASGLQKKFTFTDSNGESETVEAADEESAWEKLSKDFATSVADMKKMGMKVVKNSLENSADLGTYHGFTMKQASATNFIAQDAKGNVASASDLAELKLAIDECIEANGLVKKNSKREPCPHCKGLGDDGLGELCKVCKGSGEIKNSDPSADLEQVESAARAIEHEVGELKEEVKNKAGDRLSGADCTCKHSGSKHYDTGRGEACSSCDCEVYDPVATCKKCGQKERAGVMAGNLCESCQESHSNSLNMGGEGVARGNSKYGAVKNEISEKSINIKEQGVDRWVVMGQSRPDGGGNGWQMFSGNEKEAKDKGWDLAKSLNIPCFVKGKRI